MLRTVQRVKVPPGINICICLRVENRPSVLGIFIYSLGWGGVITFTYLRTPMMLRHGTFTCTCAHTSCYLEDVSRHAGVGWGGAITFTYLRTPMMLRHGTFTCTCAHTSCYVEDVSRHAGVGHRGGVGCGGVRWGNNVHVLASAPDQLTSCPENEQKLNDLIWTYVRTWQWRWEANVVGKALLEKTGAYLAKM